jgi:(p)ppGpp synthase/HD superfamily hydrolase
MMTPNTYLTDRYTHALQYAIQIHMSDTRKGTQIPYMSHLVQVAGLVLEFGGPEEEAIGALLHDTAEDAGGEAALADIREVFGPDVERIVRENSDSITDSKADKAPWRERKEGYIAAISHKSESALLVSVCDKIHNVRSPITDTQNFGPSHWNRFNASREDSVWYYQSLVKAFLKRVPDFPRLTPAVRELENAVGTLTDLSQSDAIC